MTPEEVLQKLTRIVIDTLGLEESFRLEPSMTAADVDGWDSLTNVQIIVAIEKSFGVRFSTGEVASMKSVAELVSRTTARLAR